MTQENENNNNQQSRPGYEEILVELNGRGFFNPVESFMTNDPELQSFLPRSRFSKRTSAQLARSITRQRFVETGEINMTETTWLLSGFSIGQDGLGRKEAERIITGKKPNNMLDRQREQSQKKLDG